MAELRRQRALVAEHLAWLDRQISALAGGDSEGAVVVSEPTKLELSAGAVPLDSSQSGMGLNPGATADGQLRGPAGGSASVLPGPEEVWESLPERERPMSPAVAQWGCLVVVLLAMGLVVFLVFGLPHLIYGSAE